MWRWTRSHPAPGDQTWGLRRGSIPGEAPSQPPRIDDRGRSVLQGAPNARGASTHSPKTRH
eukprot:scaffold38769_cov35-Tisochrysis_lutea.AAC.5